jgi:hypothetical protein
VDRAFDLGRTGPGQWLAELPEYALRSALLGGFGGEDKIADWSIGD